MTRYARRSKRSNRNAGGDRVNRGDGFLLVRTVGVLHDLDDIRRVVITTRAGRPVLVGDVADVRLGALQRYGAATANAEGETVVGLVLLRKDANSRTTVEAVKREIEAMKATLPKDVDISPFYDRAALIEAAVWTVEKALGEAVLLVLAVLVVLLGNLRAALTVALILPLSSAVHLPDDARLRRHRQPHVARRARHRHRHPGGRGRGGGRERAHPAWARA